MVLINISLHNLSYETIKIYQRVVTISKGTNAKAGNSEVPFTILQVVVTARLGDGDLGEYVCQIGRSISHFKEELKELGEKALQAESKITKHIELAGFKVLPSRYVPDDAEPIVGSP